MKAPGSDRDQNGVFGKKKTGKRRYVHSTVSYWRCWEGRGALGPAQGLLRSTVFPTYIVRSTALYLVSVATAGDGRVGTP